MPGRVEVYVHSDSVTQNKGAAIVVVECQTDFAAKTPQFIAFAKKAARMMYAVSAIVKQKSPVFAIIHWGHITEHFPEMQAERDSLTAELKESITVFDGVVRCLKSHWELERTQSEFETLKNSLDGLD